MVDLHRHDMFSRFDGFGEPAKLAQLAKSLGHTALGTSNHGNTSGLVQTYNGCKKAGIKPILGVEGYFLPKYKPQDRGYHLCVFAKNLKGYRNMNALQYAGEKQKYYNPIWDLGLLEEYHEGLICTTACIASYSSKCILAGKQELAKRYLGRLQDIFGDDLYVEIQPYVVSDAGMQEKVNRGLIELADELGLRMILTSDSHRGEKDDFDTYLKMHEMNGSSEEWVRGTYEERYMPAPMEMEKRFVKMHGEDYGRDKAKKMALQMQANLEELEASVEEDILGQLKLKLPAIDSTGGETNEQKIVRLVKEGLHKRGKWNKQYIERCKQELDVIKVNGFIDYFLIVADYVNWAKDHGICTGPGRGSACNCLVAWALYITEVDSIHFGLDFRRFMRYDKKSFPDIDIDFEMDRRGEVIDYLMTKYAGQAARVASYGFYQVDNTVNDLAKVCGLLTDKQVSPDEAAQNKQTIKDIRATLRKYYHGAEGAGAKLDVDALYTGEDASKVKGWNEDYGHIIDHFCKLFAKVRFVGTHASGVVITSGDILEYTAIRLDKNGDLNSVYNLADLDQLNIIKFDILGLKTMQSIGECRRLAGLDSFDIKYTEDPELLKHFREGDTCGVFQFEKGTAKRILSQIHCDCFNDVVATCAINRPGPLERGIPEVYAENKLNKENIDQDDIVYKYTAESYGTLVYQEQLLLICVNVGGLEWNEADKIMKFSKRQAWMEAAMEKYMAETGVNVKEKFISNAVKNGLSRDRAEATYESLMSYSFNKGHAVGYCIVSLEEMFYKVYYPQYFWYAKMKYAKDDREREEFASEATKAGQVIFLPHVNYSMEQMSIRKVEGESALQMGISEIKGIGEKAAAEIVAERKKGGIFTSYDNFYDRCAGRAVNKKVIGILVEQGALEFKKQTYIKRVKAYNVSLYSRPHKERNW